MTSNRITAFNQLINESKPELISIEPYTVAGARQSTLTRAPRVRIQAQRQPLLLRRLRDRRWLCSVYKGRIAPEILTRAWHSKSKRTTHEEKRRLFNEKGESLKLELEVALSDGKDFIETAESIGLTATGFDAFTPMDAPSELNRSALNQAQRMTAGEISHVDHRRNRHTRLSHCEERT